jgi:hypothetical protein
MICVLCLKQMKPIFEDVVLLGKLVAKPQLKGYQCLECRDILTSGILPHDFMTEQEFKHKKLILERYRMFTDSKQPLPEGYSFP